MSDDISEELIKRLLQKDNLPQDRQIDRERQYTPDRQQSKQNQSQNQPKQKNKQQSYNRLPYQYTIPWMQGLLAFFAVSVLVFVLLLSQPSKSNQQATVNTTAHTITLGNEIFVYKVIAAPYTPLLKDGIIEIDTKRKKITQIQENIIYTYFYE